MKHAGIDFGAKLAGTTAVAGVQDEHLHLWQSIKGQDADAWLEKLVQVQQLNAIFIDAPLSLPQVYTSIVPPQSADYFYRQADRELKAMSPMFLGGLTARAMRLRARFAEQGIALLETYPSHAVKLLLPHLQGYKKDLEQLQAYIKAVQGLLPLPLQQAPVNWHQFDAVLAWLSGYRHSKHQARLYGDAREGCIIV